MMLSMKYPYEPRLLCSTCSDVITAPENGSVDAAWESHQETKHPDLVRLARMRGCIAWKVVYWIRRGEKLSTHVRSFWASKCVPGSFHVVAYDCDSAMAKAVAILEDTLRCGARDSRLRDPVYSITSVVPTEPEATQKLREPEREDGVK